MRRLSWILMLLLVASAATADDGELFRKNVSKTPDLETEHATVKMMKLYVPAQTSGGELTAIEYYDAEGALAETRDQAKPLVAFYHDGEVEHVPDVGFPGHGRKDVFGAYSLDDGATWKRKNLSNTGDLSSFTLRDGTDYPGDTFRLFAAAAGNKVMVAWASRYCQGGNPGYTLSDDEIPFIAPLVGEDNAACTDDDTETLCLYMEDYWGVAGSQGSVDYGESDIVEYQAIGEVPYACLWTARGTLEPMDAEGNYLEEGEYYGIIWRKAERLTSGRRDVHRIEVAAVAGAGFVVTWQEDPEGLRPGKGEGPGEGWSGAIGNHQTDIWYSHVAWEHFDLVYVAGGDPIPYAEYTDDQIPQAGVPMAMPVRLTDNAMCVMADADGSSDDEYCYMDFDGSGSADFCASSVSYSIDTPEGPDQTVEMCVTEDGRLMRGNIASTRARTHLRGYDLDGDGTMDSAWVVLAYEESKGLGEEEDDEIDKIDMGKNIWYHTFGMFSPELVSQGMMLNQPAAYPDGYPATSADRLNPVSVTVGDTTYTFMEIDPDPIYEEQAGLDSVLYQAEIARRFSMISQPAAKAGPSGVVAFAMFKQGIIRQGGPADVMARRFVIPEECDPDDVVEGCFDPAVDNPFDYANMDCAGWEFEDGSNPRYVKGLCVAPAINMSGTSVVECEDGGED
ncbi:MAG: choice-of-anchor O protein, partial [Thermoanaerobaculia bacterium]